MAKLDNLYPLLFFKEKYQKLFFPENFYQVGIIIEMSSANFN